MIPLWSLFLLTAYFLTVINIVKSLPASLFQREEFPLIKGGQGVVDPSSNNAPAFGTPS
jgi:hypothetical protein